MKRLLIFSLVYFSALFFILGLLPGIISQAPENEIDFWNGLPVMNKLFDSAALPDAHYSVAKITPQVIILVQHKAGPDRNFVYYITNFRSESLPQNYQAGDRFTIHKGRAYL